MQDQVPPEAAKEIEHVKSLVARHFPVYDVKVKFDVIEFYCSVDPLTLEEGFERLREEMKPKGYIPMITYSKGENVVVVGKRPKTRYRSIKVNVAMLLITFAAVMFAGILDWASYADVPNDELYSLNTIAMGILFFAAPLLAILGIHELGHFFMARRRKVAASLPFFIPSIPPLGTFGAFISLRDPIPNRKSLLEIGISGPIAGLLVAIPIGIIGLMLTNMDARAVPTDFESGSIVRVAFPLMYGWIEQLIPIEGDYLLHPTAFAAWVGFLVTALNLLPAGQLDGGHIARALLGDKARFASWVTIAILIMLSFFYFAWLFFAVLILFLGARHPPPLNDITVLDTKRRLAGVMAFVILVLAFVPVPVSVVTADHSFDMTPAGSTNATIRPGEAAEFSFVLQSTGNVDSNITVEASDLPDGWAVSVRVAGAYEFTETASCRLATSENETFDLRIVPSGLVQPGNESIVVVAYAHSTSEDKLAEESIWYNLTVTTPVMEFWPPNEVAVSAGSDVTATVQVNNTATEEVDITLTVVDLPSLIGVTLYESVLGPNSTGTLDIVVPGEGSSTFEVLVFASSSITAGDYMVTIQATYHGVDLALIDIPLSVS